ncbi:MAG: HAD family hydrolase [Microscillaceae bacterium]|nr:HAD family hydrolase [Microscillaceae bacterium]
MQKAVFLDRDGVLNRDRVNYVYRLADFEILPGVPQALQALKAAGYRLIVVTNQSGIAKGLYTHQEVALCYEYLQQQCGGQIDAHYYAPYHPEYDSASLSRKPDSLMIEKGLARFGVKPAQCWLVGDSERDLVAAKKCHLRTIYIPEGSARFVPPAPESHPGADFMAAHLPQAVEIILAQDRPLAKPGQNL